jgi:peptide/nickel transport system substrate-binding protein
VRPWLTSGGLITGLAGAVVALACSSPLPAPANPEPVVLTIGVPQGRQNDPTHTIDTLASLLSNQRLTASDASGEATPLLIERWDVASGGLEWRLTLRPDVVFHDGSPVTSADVVRTLQETTQSPERSAATACMADVTSVRAESDREVVIRLTRPCAILLDDIDYPVTKPGATGVDLGTGPFVRTPGAQDAITLAANKGYFLGTPAIDQVVFRAYATLREGWAEMLRGRVDFLWEVGPEAAEFLREQSSVELRSHLSYFVYTIAFNSARRPLGRIEVRQALNLAIDREALLKQALRGQGIAAASPVWPNHWARPQGSPALPYAPREAVAALGRVLGRGAATGGRTPVLTFTCLLPEGFTVYERLALLVQQQLRAIDVDMRLEALAPDAFNQKILARDFDAVLLPLLSGSNLAAHYRFWHSPSPSERWNFWGYRSRIVDEALDTLREAHGPNEVRAAVARLDAGLREDPPGIVLVWGQTLQAVSRRFIVPESGRGRDALHVLWAWKPFSVVPERP